MFKYNKKTKKTLGDKKKKKKLNMDQELKEFRKQEKESKFTYLFIIIFFTSLEHT